MNENSTGATWVIREIDAHLMPPEKDSKWWALYQEIVLRLEQTGDKYALEIHIPEGGYMAPAPV